MIREGTFPLNISPFLWSSTIGAKMVPESSPSFGKKSAVKKRVIKMESKGKE